MCVYEPCVCPVPEEVRIGHRSPEAGLTDSCEHHVSTGSQTQLLCRSKRSLSCLSSPWCENFYLVWFFGFGEFGGIYLLVCLKESHYVALAELELTI